MLGPGSLLTSAPPLAAAVADALALVTFVVASLVGTYLSRPPVRAPE